MCFYFTDRRHAGRVLATELDSLAGRTDLVVLALPRGGVPVAYEVAQSLRAPLDVFVARKLGVPGHEELAMGALASQGLVVLNHDVIENLEITQKQILEAARVANRERESRERYYRGDQPPIDVAGKMVLLIDDGVATGATLRAAILALRQRRPASVIAAVPVGAEDVCSELAEEADDMVCAAIPEPFFAVGLGYEDFSQTTDDEVRELFAASRTDPRTREPAVHEQGAPA